MANGTQAVFAGNVTKDVELRRTQSGVAVLTFSVAVAHRVKDSDQWKDGRTTFIDCTVWRQQAEHAANSLRKGVPVIVSGLTYEEAWESNGRECVSTRCDVDEVGVSLRFGTATYERSGGGSARVQGGGGGYGGGQASGGYGSSSGGYGASTGGDWATAAPGSGGGAGYNDETPF
jgi:single-strand DNA-binding protein